MSGLAAAALWALLAVGPNDGPLHAALAAGSGDLPLAAAAPAVGRLWLVFHHRDEGPAAIYLGPDGHDLVVTALAAAARGDERLLPGLRLPRLLLRASWYRGEAGAPREVPTLAVDAAEHLFRALLAARLDLGLPLAYRLEAERRADVLLVEVPAEQRLDAYLDAGADFVSHLLSVGHELGRAVARGSARGGDPCALADPPQLLFARWEKAFAAGDFRALYRPAGSAPEAVATTRAGLERQDKRWFLSRLLGVDWSGELAHDLPGLCPRR